MFPESSNLLDMLVGHDVTQNQKIDFSLVGGYPMLAGEASAWCSAGSAARHIKTQSSSGAIPFAALFWRVTLNKNSWDHGHASLD